MLESDAYPPDVVAHVEKACLEFERAYGKFIDDFFGLTDGHEKPGTDRRRLQVHRQMDALHLGMSALIVELSRRCIVMGASPRTCLTMFTSVATRVVADYAREMGVDDWEKEP